MKYYEYFTDRRKFLIPTRMERICGKPIVLVVMNNGSFNTWNSICHYSIADVDSTSAAVIGPAAGVDEATAFAATMCYRLITFYLPPIWGAAVFRHMERTDLL